MIKFKKEILNRPKRLLVYFFKFFIREWIPKIKKPI